MISNRRFWEALVLALVAIVGLGQTWQDCRASELAAGIQPPAPNAEWLRNLGRFEPPRPDFWPEKPDRKVHYLPEEEFLRRTIYVILDGSGSMDGPGCLAADTSKAAVVKRNLLRWLPTLPEGTLVALAIFDRNPDWQRIPLSEVVVARWQQELEASPLGGTSDFTSVLPVVTAQINQRALQQKGYGSHQLLIITDGPYKDRDPPYRALWQVAAHNGIDTHVFGLCVPPESTLNLQGWLHFYAITQEQEFYSAISAVKGLY